MDIFSFVFLLGYGFVVYLLPWIIVWWAGACLFSALDGRRS